jgi:hypothetical protein
MGIDSEYIVAKEYVGGDKVEFGEVKVDGKYKCP